MKREITNIIRKVMDEYLPPVIRDNRVFMYPFFWYWFKGKKVSLYMDFKKIAYTLSQKEFEQCYSELDCRATDRLTDLNEKCIQYMMKSLLPGKLSLLDVGCGRGYWVNLVKQNTNYDLYGCDIFEERSMEGIKYIKGNIEKLPFPDKSFDVITCHHTIEHVIDIKKAISELKRVARKQLIIVTPKQKYFYYTLDLHLHFFLQKEDLTNLIDLPRYECIDMGGDWCYVAYFDSENPG